MYKPSYTDEKLKEMAENEDIVEFRYQMSEQYVNSDAYFDYHADQVHFVEGMMYAEELEQLRGAIKAFDQALEFINKRESPGVTALNVNVLREQAANRLKSILEDKE